MFIRALFTKLQTGTNPNAINKWIDEQILVYLYNGIILRKKNQWTIDTING